MNPPFAPPRTQHARPEEAALAADRYAMTNPWRVAGAALAVGALVGFLLARVDCRDPSSPMTARHKGDKTWVALAAGAGGLGRPLAQASSKAAIAAERPHGPGPPCNGADLKRRLQQLLVLTILVAGLTVVALIMVSLAVLVHRIRHSARWWHGWWLACQAVGWAAAAVSLSAAQRVQGSGFTLTRRARANWRDIKGACRYHISHHATGASAALPPPVGSNACSTASNCSVVAACPARSPAQARALAEQAGRPPGGEDASLALRAAGFEEHRWHPRGARHGRRCAGLLARLIRWAGIVLPMVMRLRR